MTTDATDDNGSALSFPDEPHVQAPQITIQAWREYVAHIPEDPGRPTMAQLAAMTDSDRIVCGEQRLDYFTRMAPMMTPFVKSVVRLGERQRRTHRRNTSATVGLIVDGRPDTGKTTAIKTLGLAVELAFRRKYPNLTDAAPVVITLMPHSGSTKQLAQNICESIGVPVTAGWSQRAVTRVACDGLTRGHTELLIIDEAHLLARTESGARKAAAQLKEIADKTTCTMVLAGIQLETAAFMQGILGEQFDDRFVLVESPMYLMSPAAERKIWRNVLDSFEERMLLADYEPGFLRSLDRPLLGVTGGKIGPLHRLLQRCQEDAIDSGEEKLSFEIVDDIVSMFIRKGRKAQWQKDTATWRS